MFGKWLPQLSPTAHSLLANERTEREDEALKARALERAQATLEGERWSGIQLRSAESEAAFVRRSRTVRTVLLIAAALALAGLATAGVRLAIDHESGSPVVAAVKPTVVPSPPNQIEAKIPLVPTAQVEETKPEPARPVPSSHARLSSAGQYAIEVELLQPARTGIARGDYGAALSAIGRHQREYPNGQLTEEREALKVRALWGSGQKRAAETAATAFRRRYPRSGLLAWMKAPAP